MLNMPESIEENVHNALNRKIDNMSSFLNDPSLQSLVGFNQPDILLSSDINVEDVDLQVNDEDLLDLN